MCCDICCLLKKYVSMGFSAVKQTHCMYSISLGPLHGPSGTWEAWGADKYADAHAAFCAMCHKVHCLQLRSLVPSASMHVMVVS